MLVECELIACSYTPCIQTAVKKKRRKKKTHDTRTEDIRVPKRKVYKTELDILNEPLTQEEAYANAFSNHALSPQPSRHSTKTKATASTRVYENASRTNTLGYATLPSPCHHRSNASPVEKQLSPPPRFPPPAPPIGVSPAASHDKAAVNHDKAAASHDKAAASHDKASRTTYSPGQHTKEVTQTLPTPAHAESRFVSTPQKDVAQPDSLPSNSVPKHFSPPDRPPVPSAVPPPPAAPSSAVEADTRWDQTNLPHTSSVPTHPPVHQPSGTIPRDPPPPTAPAPAQPSAPAPTPVPPPAPPHVMPPAKDTIAPEPMPPNAIKVATAAVEPRNDLLEAIRQGKKLRTVEPLTVPKTVEFQGMDVASILARRVAFVSDSESEFEEGSDEEEWSD